MRRIHRSIFFIALLALFTSCTNVPVKTEPLYAVEERKHLYNTREWAFEGRVSVTDGRESWSANIVWGHQNGKDEIKLSGPLGQGAAVITLTNNWVSIDRGDDKPKESNQVDEFIQQQLGVFVPMLSLRYWVLGLPHPSDSFIVAGDGFAQSRWYVHYLQMQNLGKEWLPQKIAAEQGEAKLKLFIDKWTL
jgi:outer membrane lipoprotein LolB